MGTLSSMAQVVHNNRFRGLSLDLDDIENTSAIVDDAINAVRRENKIKVENRRYDFVERLLEARDDMVYGPRQEQPVQTELVQTEIIPVEQPPKKVRVDEFDFAKPGLGFVERFEGPRLGKNQSKLVRAQIEKYQDGILTLDEYEAQQNLKVNDNQDDRAPAWKNLYVQPVYKKRRGKKKLVLDHRHLNLIGADQKLM